MYFPGAGYVRSYLRPQQGIKQTARAEQEPYHGLPAALGDRLAVAIMGGGSAISRCGGVSPRVEGEGEDQLGNIAE